MNKLKFFKGLILGLVVSIFMWGGIVWTILQIDKLNSKSEISEVEEPVAANFSLAAVKE